MPELTPNPPDGDRNSLLSAEATADAAISTENVMDEAGPTDPHNSLVGSASADAGSGE